MAIPHKQITGLPRQAHQRFGLPATPNLHVDQPTCYQIIGELYSPIISRASCFS
jgi:hypothetical protein